MLVFTLFISFFLATDGGLLPQFDWFLPDESVLDSHKENLYTDFIEESSSWGSPSGSATIFDDLENLTLEQPNPDFDDYGDDASSSYLADMIGINADCESYGDGVQPSRKKPRAERSCPADQKLRNSQQDPDGETSDERITGNEMPKGDNTRRLQLLDGLPLVDFHSMDRQIGYCPEYFYGLLVIPVCASADPAYIKKILPVYYNLDHAMRSMIFSCFLTFFWLNAVDETLRCHSFSRLNYAVERD